MDAYKEALRSYPHDYDAAWGIARIYCHETRHYRPCLEWTERLLDVYPDRAAYRRARAEGLRLRAAAARAGGDTAAATEDEAAAAALD